MVRIPTLIPKTWVGLAQDSWRLIFESGSYLDTAWRIAVLVAVAVGIVIAATLSSIPFVGSIIVLTIAFTVSDRVIIGTITDFLERRFYVLEVDAI